MLGLPVSVQACSPDKMHAAGLARNTMTRGGRGPCEPVQVVYV